MLIQKQKTWKKNMEWITIRRCEFFNADGTTFFIEKGTRLKEVSYTDHPKMWVWRAVAKARSHIKAKNKNLVPLWFDGKPRLFHVGSSVVKCSQGVGNIWKI